MFNFELLFLLWYSDQVLRFSQKGIAGTMHMMVYQYLSCVPAQNLVCFKKYACMPKSVNTLFKLMSPMIQSDSCFHQQWAGFMKLSCLTLYPKNSSYKKTSWLVTCHDLSFAKSDCRLTNQGLYVPLEWLGTFPRCGWASSWLLNP